MKEALPNDSDKVFRIREADLNDCRDLWEWRNHKQVRKWSLQSEIIPYKEHEVWFNRVLNNSDRKIFIVENNLASKIAQIRFDQLNDSQAMINVNLNPAFFSKGYGNKVIRLATEFYQQKNKHIKEIIAEIIQGNIASIKAFIKAGYQSVGKTVKDGKELEVYQFSSFRKL